MDEDRRRLSAAEQSFAHALGVLVVSPQHPDRKMLLSIVEETMREVDRHPKLMGDLLDVAELFLSAEAMGDPRTRSQMRSTAHWNGQLAFSTFLRWRLGYAWEACRKIKAEAAA